MNTALGIIAFIFYLLAASRLGVLIYASEDVPRQQAKIQAFSVGAIAIILNGFLLNSAIFVSDGLDLGFSNTWALISWIIAMVILLVAVRKPVENLLVIFFHWPHLDYYSYYSFQVTVFWPNRQPWV